MTPKNIDWKMFLGTEFGLAPDMPFDRAKFAQWRCYWDFGAGMFTDLFVHRTTSMLKATGLRFPAASSAPAASTSNTTTATCPMWPPSSPISPKACRASSPPRCAARKRRSRRLIRGHHGSFVFGNGEEFEGYDFVAERPQVTHNSKIKNERIEVGQDRRHVARPLHELLRCGDGRQAGAWSTARPSSARRRWSS